ncbi:bi-functional transferase/deacetylase [Asanoa ishikariensis]|uniref:Glycosyltransferase, catalytic subunit of cellulose synthase and poly-beta-1,6-N-acetylglucosamine synthase n=1 Tax=Asanoa ishikariensis TaxID=137265 RepID=A0A1H3RQK1_9ACTN|nr:bifunctional polysaccharide deacetylase/glycosyltransferase family 2 protein [Asanoa ishikariensis]GIF66989.1 bi-functional transferase/deacetylase [Asanoa ishikariensis]SDZ27491.1 Glycosyltransferase, catalytic subunit of cellulose synthase and poly-beta-1,6-N-acetylglucosamine synthase [Asanoa ishikariensis]
MGTWREGQKIGDTQHIATPEPRKSRFAGRRWIIAGVGTLVLANLLAIGAYANSRFAPDNEGEPGLQDAVPAAVRDGGPVVDTRTGRVASHQVPDRTIVLTFDDGPDPLWTPQVLDVLHKHGVPATFFVLGSQTSRHPEFVDRMVREGHEVGVHTFTHPDLAGMDGWRQRLEISQTRSAIAYAAGVTTPLLRLPYSSGVDSLDNKHWSVVQGAGGQNMVSVFDDTDSRDWARPGVDQIVRSSTPPDGRGAVVLLHDAGGDRSQTVAALDTFIPQMRQRGYRFTTVEGAFGDQAPGLAAGKASRADQIRGGLLVWAVKVADGTNRLLWFLLLLVGALTLIRTLVLFGFALRHARRRRARTWSWGAEVHEPVTVIVPAYNERRTIAAAVRTLATGNHPGIEVLVIDDESDDGTAEEVEALGLPNVRVVRVPGGGKASALNAGIALARHDLLVMVDADTVVTPDAIHKLVQPFADPRVGAVAGNVKVGNRRRLIGLWQHIEYVIGFNLDRRLYDTLRCMPTIPGALGGFRRQAVHEAGGLSRATLAEDTDLTMAIHRAGWRVVYEETAVARTEAPDTLGQLWRQRYRWSYGTMQAMWRHRRAVVEHGASGRFGRRGLPFIALFSVVLPLFAPVLDILAVYGLFFLDRVEALVAWLVVMVIQAVTAILAFRLDREPLRPLWTLPLQQLVYRQMMYLVLVHAAATALTGGLLKWQHLRRSGEVAAEA